MAKDNAIEEEIRRWEPHRLGDRIRLVVVFMSLRQFFSALPRMFIGTNPTTLLVAFRDSGIDGDWTIEHSSPMQGTANKS